MSTVISIFKMAIRAFLGFILACCFISGTTADVPDGVVYTDLHQNAQLGSRAVLKCEFYRTPLAVYWKKGDNPSTAQNLITWFKGKPDSGSCVKDKTCEIGDDYSLIIKNVSIANQGRYICRVSNYRGTLIHNFTDVKVYATPEGPYPVIQECEGYHGQNCTIDYSTSINITCSASRYFPNIDLLFLHGAQTVTIIKTFEWTNADGTKSKYISTRAPPSKIPYVCVAFNIPGSRDERTATILVFHQDANRTFGSAGESEKDQTPIIKIVVSVGVSVLGLCIPILLCCSICRRKEIDATAEERQHLLQGPVSLYELWYLASYKTTDDHKKNLRNVLTELDISDIKEGQLTSLEAYNALCTWRKGKAKEEQLKALENALGKVRYDGAWTDMYEKRKDTSIHVSPEAPKRILKYIGNVSHMNKFLSELTEGRTNISGETAHVLQVCSEELTGWITSRRYRLNPFVLLSLALEKVGCTALDLVDFLVPENLQSPITDDGLEKFLNELIARHCERLAINLTIELRKLKAIIWGNNHYLFDTKSMITSWLRDGECSDFRKKCRLDDAIIRIGRCDLQDRFETSSYRDGVGLPAEHPHPKPHQFDAESIFDDDIPHLAKMIRCIPPDKKTQFQEKTDLNPDDNAEDDTLEERIKTWRDSIMANVSKDQSLNKFRSLRKELSNTKYSELTLTDEEIENMAAHVTSADKEQELMSRLHIDNEGQQTIVEQLKTWRNTNVTPNCRDTLRQALEPFGLAQCIRSKGTTKHVAPQELPRIALDLLMEDVRPIIKALGIDQKVVSKYVQRWDGKGNSTIDLVMKLLNSGGLLGTSELNRDDFCKALRKVGFVDVARSVYFGRYETESQEGRDSGGDVRLMSKWTVKWSQSTET